MLYSQETTNQAPLRARTGQALSRLGAVAGLSLLLLAHHAAGPAATRAAPPTLHHAEPPNDGKDWVQLTTGEWLRGEALRFRDGALEFDSDRLHEHSIKLKYICRLFLRRPAVFVLDDLETLEGPARVVEGELLVQTPGGPSRAPIDRLMTMVPTTSRELERWRIDASVGLNISRGNVEQTVFNASAALEREDELTDVVASYTGNYAESRSRTIANNHRADAGLDVFLSPAFFLRPLSASLEANEFKNVRLRLTAFSGVGVRLLDHSDVRWQAAAAGGYLQVRFDSVGPGQRALRRHVAGVLATAFDADVTPDVDFRFEYHLLITAEDLGLMTHHAEAKLEVDLTDIFDVELNLVFDRTEEPVADENDQVPKRNDISFIVSLGIDIG